ncbi:hypothetical protein THAOC_08800, partial [Thalassiosira oceanica]
ALGTPSSAEEGGFGVTTWGGIEKLPSSPVFTKLRRLGASAEDCEAEGWGGGARLGVRPPVPVVTSSPKEKERFRGSRGAPEGGQRERRPPRTDGQLTLDAAKSAVFDRRNRGCALLEHKVGLGGRISRREVSSLRRRKARKKRRSDDSPGPQGRAVPSRAAHVGGLRERTIRRTPDPPSMQLLRPTGRDPIRKGGPRGRAVGRDKRKSRIDETIRRTWVEDGMPAHI